MPLNYGTLAGGLGNSFKNFATAIPQAQRLQAQSEVLGKQARAADYAQAMKEASQDAVNFIAQNANVDPRYVQGSADPTELMNRLKLNAGMRAYGAAGMLNPVEQVVQAVQHNQASLPQESSYSEDAGVTPSIDSLKLKGNNSYQEAPPQDVRSQVQANVGRNADLLRQIIQDTGAIENALKGNGMYQSTPNGGYFNKFYGDGGVYDDVARAIYQNDKQSQIANRENQIANRNSRLNLAQSREARIRANVGRHGGGGHRRGGRGSSGSSRGGGDDNVRGAGGGSASPAPQHGGWQPNARQLKALDDYKAGKISYDQLVSTK